MRRYEDRVHWVDAMQKKESGEYSWAAFKKGRSIQHLWSSGELMPK
jgi:hypothetical protein